MMDAPTALKILEREAKVAAAEGKGPLCEAMLRAVESLAAETYAELREGARARLAAVHADALRVHAADRGTPSESFDAGRCDALKEALAIVGPPHG